MKKAADFLTWFVVIDEIIGMWVVCLINFFEIKAYGGNAWWLILIPIVATLFLLFLAGFRQDAVNNGEDYVKWGVITLLFLSIPGGILTICLNSTPSRSYKFKYYSSKKPKPEIEEKPVEEYIFVKPSAERNAEVGDTAKIVNGFYISSLGKRVNSDDVCEIYQINGDEVTVAINHGTAFFHATTQLNNLLLKIKNPEFEKKVEEVKQVIDQSSDKFEELKKYKELLDLNVITQEEFDAKKKELL